ncbi:quinone-dependent dihydroorotate dehydrogenase [Aquimarina sp. TRL1]|uniref:quinone-dependent dihydroorotate dehydrogenase n=1 Tax=Aquimarina sp. (strain TRL1) TaxID=2736252 RepID=UPI00158B19D0|nr:quinone-dependent dihydroorotate dehydrogenase [Aquimarina sp. TRL1]QKX05764.1 quinone-dependent dihydroorotate dehydrogenase [Aquimarina sp. TRL1]
MYKTLVRPILFLFDPEKVHHFTFAFIKIISKIPFMPALFRKMYLVKDKRLEREVFGLKFSNPVGLAAGFDKEAKLYNELSNFGFGFIEIGTITPKAQSGNPKTRLFRLKEDQGIINRMGFNNQGIEAAIKNLKKRNTNLVIGGNIGKNTDTTPDDYTADYEACFKALHPYVDYFVVNVSCPNVGSHAKLQDKGYLLELLGGLKKINAKEASPKPIVLKIAPDLNNQQLDEIIEVVKETGIDGVIASNTSVNRTGLKTSEARLNAIGNGGLSGKPITERSTRVIKYLSEHSDNAFPIVGVGGIHTAKDALDKLAAGATLVQVYTGFIYEGPKLVKEINKALLK